MAQGQQDGRKLLFTMTKPRKLEPGSVCENQEVKATERETRQNSRYCGQDVHRVGAARKSAKKHVGESLTGYPLRRCVQKN